MSSNPYFPPGPPYNERDDEIDLAELAGQVWNTRWRVFAAVLLSLLLYGAYLALGIIIEEESPVTYREVFELNFDGLEDGQYPDGSQFVLSSLLSQTVLNRVHERNGLGDEGITVADLRESLFVEPYSAEFPLIRKRYEQRLADEDLSATEIEEMEAEMRRELSLASAGSVRLSLQLPPDVTLDQPTIDALLSDIPRVWADRAIVEQGVLDLNQAIYSAEIFSESQYARLDYPVAIDLLQENIELMRGDIAELRARPQADSVRDPETRLRLIDLDKRLRDILRFELAEVIDPVRELGLTRDPQGATLYLERQLREVRLEQRFWEERARLTRALISGDDPAGRVLTDGRPASGSNMNLTAQIDGSFLDRLMDIARQGDGEEFRQSLVRQILDYEEAALTRAQEAQRIERSLKAITQPGAAATYDEEEYRALLEARLPEVLATLREYANALQRIAEAISQQASGNISELVTAVGGSFEVSQASILTKRAIIVAVAIAFLVGFVTMVLSLLSDAMKRRRSAPMPEERPGA